MHVGSKLVYDFLPDLPEILTSTLYIDGTLCHDSPFDMDKWLLTAQICSIVAACISWTWWPVFVLSAPIVVVLQTAWCCKMKKAGLIAAGILSCLNFVGAVFIGIWMKMECWNTLFVVIMNDDNYYNYSDPSSFGPDGCYFYNTTERKNAWMAVALIDAVLFLATAVCTFWFVFKRYDAILECQNAQALEQQQADEVMVNVPAAATTVEMAVIASPAYSTAPEARASAIFPDDITKDMDRV